VCGISGYFNPRGVTEDDIEKMNTALRHRGPDGSGVYLGGGGTAGLGHRRLAIIDLEGGKEPMSNEDGTLWVTFNGEIYNFEELRRDLEKGHLFKTRSDTEVVLHLYEEKGEDCVLFLRGMFAFAIYDSRGKKLFLARDHLGQKPLYYHHDGRVFAFASEIKALLAIKPELAELDCAALHEYLSIRIVTPPRSMFRRIRKLPPGHTLGFRDGKVELRRYWDLRYQPKMKVGLDEAVEELEREMRSAVKYHLVSDVPVGAFLSGGLDSSLVVAMMSEVSGDPVKTFSGDVPYRGYSELPFTRVIAERFRTDHHELKFHPSLVQSLPELVWHLDEPSDPLSVCLYHLSEFAREEVKVVLGGDGGDELFGGYDRYYGNVMVDYYALLPAGLRRRVIGKVLKLMPEGFWYRSLSHKLRWMHEMSFSEGGERYARSLSYFYFDRRFRSTLYTEKFRECAGGFDALASVREYFDSGNAEAVIDKMLYADSMTRLPNHPIMILDRMSMAHGLEARSPFLDHKLAEFCARLPVRLKVRGVRRRYVQTALAKKLLPDSIARRKKQGFSSALPYLLAGEFRLLYRTFLEDSSLIRDGYLNRGAVRSLLDEHSSRKADHGNRLWLICNAEVWYRMYIEGKSREAMAELLKSQAAASERR